MKTLAALFFLIAAPLSAATLPEIEGVYPGIEVEWFEEIELTGVGMVDTYKVTGETICAKSTSDISDKGLTYITASLIQHPVTKRAANAFYFALGSSTDIQVMLIFTNRVDPNQGCLDLIMVKQDDAA